MQRTTLAHLGHHAAITAALAAANWLDREKKHGDFTHSTRPAPSTMKEMPPTGLVMKGDVCAEHQHRFFQQDNQAATRAGDIEQGHKVIGDIGHYDGLFGDIAAHGDITKGDVAAWQMAFGDVQAGDIDFDKKLVGDVGMMLQ